MLGLPAKSLYADNLHKGFLFVELRVLTKDTIGLWDFTGYEQNKHYIYSTVSDDKFYHSRGTVFFCYRIFLEMLKAYLVYVSGLCKIVSCNFRTNAVDGVAGDYIADRKDYFCKYVVKD